MSTQVMDLHNAKRRISRRYKGINDIVLTCTGQHCQLIFRKGDQASRANYGNGGECTSQRRHIVMSVFPGELWSCVNLNLPSRECPKAGGGGMKKFHPKENFIFDEWRKKGFSDQYINPGTVVSFWDFVKQVCE